MTFDDLDGWGQTKTLSNENEGFGISEENFEIKESNSTGSQKIKKLKSGGFQTMGLSYSVLQGVLHKGYKIPTPIQRKAIPLILEGKDVVAMARTGSGKTAAFLVPMFEKLQNKCSSTGVRALIVSPTRELALQTLSFAKALGKYTGLRAASVLGGDSMHGQFAAIHESPDIIVATPGRFTHVCVEMNLKLDTVQYVVFDEADRLFEMGFAEQLQETLARLPPLRQTLLFSATLPKILVSFARAGLNDPTLIRLDLESKISENLKLGLFKVNHDNKLPLLIHLLKNVIKKREATVIFAPTNHHVEYLHNVLTGVGLSSTYVYSSLDATARKINIAKFSRGKCSLLVVTDVAARGIDIPLLDNVINFNFPPTTKLFVHRVGRVARAGRRGVAYTFVSPDELNYLVDLHMFLGEAVKFCPVPDPGSSDSPNENQDWDKMLGGVPQEIIDDNTESIKKMVDVSYELGCLQKWANNGMQRYIATRPTSSSDTCRRLKEELWGREVGIHPLFVKFEGQKPIEIQQRHMLDMLKKVRPKTTVFEIKGAETPAAICMQQKRKFDQSKIESFRAKLEQRKEKAQLKEQQKDAEVSIGSPEASTTKRKKGNLDHRSYVSIVQRFSQPRSSEDGLSQSDQFIPYAASDHLTEKSYSFASNFHRDSSNAAMDLMGEEGGRGTMDQDDHRAAGPNRGRVQVKWDRKKKKYISQVKEKKIKTESGVWVPVSYKKDLYAKWKLRVQPKENDLDPDEENLSNKQGNQKGKGKNKFVYLNETSTLRGKPHPLVKGKKREQLRASKSGPRQMMPRAQVVKHVQQKLKQRRQQKQRTERNKAKRQFSSKNKQRKK